MLDGNKDNLKLEAMKRIIGVRSIVCLIQHTSVNKCVIPVLINNSAFLHFYCLQMVAKGKDASELFPAVVKNVVSKNIEVNFLIYFTITHIWIKNYASECPLQSSKYLIDFICAYIQTQSKCVTN